MCGFVVVFEDVSCCSTTQAHLTVHLQLRAESVHARVDRFLHHDGRVFHEGDGCQGNDFLSEQSEKYQHLCLFRL